MRISPLRVSKLNSGPPEPTRPLEYPWLRYTNRPFLLLRLPATGVGVRVQIEIREDPAVQGLILQVRRESRLKADLHRAIHRLEIAGTGRILGEGHLHRPFTDCTWPSPPMPFISTPPLTSWMSKWPCTSSTMIPPWLTFLRSRFMDVGTFNVISKMNR